MVQLGQLGQGKGPGHHLDRLAGQPLRILTPPECAMVHQLDLWPHMLCRLNIMWYSLDVVSLAER